MENPKIGVIGCGRFGHFWASLLHTLRPVAVYDSDPARRQEAESAGLDFLPLADLCRQADILFLCVPINQVDAAIQSLVPHLRPGMVIVDTCSVKVHPARVMERILWPFSEISLVLTHPMFGPDSGAGGVTGLPVVLWALRARPAVMDEIRGLFGALGLRIVEIPPDEHDRLVANSQGVTHQIGRVLDEMKIQPTPIDTAGFKNLSAVVQQTCNDTWELFSDLQNYNPYTREMRYRLEHALERVNSRLLPERISPDEIIIGIQGGRGSFNEEACRHYCAQHAEAYPQSRIEYLYTSKNVLTALHQGRVDYGVFAVQNAKGGAVMETIHALTLFPCEILEIFDVVISHCILHHPDIQFNEVDTLISHPQALAQSAENLKMLYPHLRLVSGEGDLVDQALCAEHIAAGKLPPTTAVLAPRVCAQLYHLTVHDTDLQDLGKKNLTTFAWARRRRFEPL